MSTHYVVKVEQCYFDAKLNIAKAALSILSETNGSIDARCIAADELIDAANALRFDRANGALQLIEAVHVEEKSGP